MWRSTPACRRNNRPKNRRLPAKWRLYEKCVVADGSSLDEELCFIDDGYSGTTLQRPALERLRDQAYAGAFQKLYVHSPD